VISQREEQGISAGADTTCFTLFTDRVSSFRHVLLRCQTLVPDLNAVASKYHAGQLSAQLESTEPLLFQVGIVSKVIPTVSAIAALTLISRCANLACTPRMAGGKNNSKLSLERESIRNRARQNKHGRNDKAALTHKVRREQRPVHKTTGPRPGTEQQRLHNNKKTP